MEYRNKIFNCEDDKFKEYLEKSKNYSNLVRLILNDKLLSNKTISNISNRYKIDLLKKIKKLELDTSHFKKQNNKKVDLDEKLVENKKYRSDLLKELLYKEKIKEEKCEKCGIGDIWDGMRICLQLDHINGNHNDNRIENIRILCAICHSQTSTYCTGQSGTYASGARKKIFEYDDDKFKEIVAKSKSYRDVVSLILNDKLLSYKSITNITERYKNDLLKKIKKLELDISHFKKQNYKKVDLKKVLVENSKHHSNILKKLLYREQIKEEKCEKCGIDPEYNGLPFAMHLDHINGDRKDNRIENIRILCPNCHSQTTTYCCNKLFNDTDTPSKEKNNMDTKPSRKPKKEYKCSKCNTEIDKSNTSKLCKDCKTKRPSKEQLLVDLKEFKTIIAIGKKYETTDHSVRRWIKKYEITNFKSILKNLEKN